VLLALTLCALWSDTLRISRALVAPVFDGVATEAEYGTPAVTLATRQGMVRVWAVRLGDTAFVAAHLQDSTFYWGDDFVVSIDPLGDRTPAPGHDDVQWYIRRVLDSSVVYQGRHGRWMPPNDDPDWRLGDLREETSWTVKSATDRAGWSVEIRLPLEWFGDRTGRRARVAVRVYDDAPYAWYAWPSPLEGERPTRIEQLPERWAVVDFLK
jgi:hypothetical protein